ILNYVFLKVNVAAYIPIAKARGFTPLLDKEFKCYACNIDNFTLEFERAYKLECSFWDDSNISDCVYRVNGREFTDLSFAKGTVLENLQGDDDNGVKLKQYEDGTKFLLFHYDVPTFDSSDREYNSDCVFSAYRDDSGVKLIHCHYGYKLPRIYFYLNLKKSNEEFDKLLEYIK
ncbi:MAG: hypothetical protein IJU91_02230, partial [Selenomonadaceae bacterium]|nr:hypothetical protein [Selenomonadaceae bacterium]